MTNGYEHQKEKTSGRQGEKTDRGKKPQGGGKRRQAEKATTKK